MGESDTVPWKSTLKTRADKWAEVHKITSKDISSDQLATIQKIDPVLGLQYGACINNKKVIEYSLGRIETSIDVDKIYSAMECATQNGHPHMIRYLIEIISDKMKRNLLTKTVKGKNIYLSDKYSISDVIDEGILRAYKISKRYRHKEISSMLYNMATEDLQMKLSTIQ